MRKIEIKYYISFLLRYMHRESKVDKAILDYMDSKNIKMLESFPEWEWHNGVTTIYINGDTIQVKDSYRIVTKPHIVK